MKPNPYQVLGTNRVVMRGREEPINKLCRHLTKATPDHVSVIGPKFIGKTVILEHIAKRFSDDNPHYITALCWDLRHSTPESDADFKQRFAGEVKNALHPVRPDLAAELDLTRDDIGEMLEAIFSIIEDDGQRVLAVFDGFDRVLDAGAITRNLWDYLRDLAHKTSLRLVIGSQRRLQELCKTEGSRTSDFWEIFYDTPLEISPLAEDDIEGFLEPFLDLDITFDTSARKEIMNWAGGVPLLTAAIMARIFEHVKSGSTVLKQDVDHVAQEVLVQCQSQLDELWLDCKADMQADLATLTEREIPLSEIPELRSTMLKKRGYVKVSRNRLKSSCRIMEHFARQKSSGVANLQRLFGTYHRFEQNIRSLLEMRLSQTRNIDRDLHKYVENAIRDLYPKPGDSTVWMRTIADRALEIVWEAELPLDRTLPQTWKEEWKHAGERWSEDSQGRLPQRKGSQCQILRLMTGTMNAKPVAKYLTKTTYLLLDHLQSIGDFGQHKEGDIGLHFAASACMTAVALCESIVEDMSTQER